MKVTKSMLHKDLRASYYLLKITPFLLSRKWGVTLLNWLLKFTKGKNIKGLSNEERYISSGDGYHQIRVRIFRPPHIKDKLPVLFYFHGGGLAIGNPEMAISAIKHFIKTRPCCVIAPDYRKSLSAPYPAAFNDCYDTITWAKENAEALNIHDSKFMIAGHSAGGGLTAAVSLKARDTGDFNIAFQMPMYPMLDDRLEDESSINMKVPAFDSHALSKCWGYYLKGLRGGNESIPIYAAPGRNKDYRNLPPSITFVGEYDPLRVQVNHFVEALKKEGIPVVWKFYKGCFHGFEDVVPNAEISKDAINFTFQSFALYYDRYVLQ